MADVQALTAEDPTGWTQVQLRAAKPLHRIIEEVIGHGSLLNPTIAAADLRNVFVGFVFNNGYSAWFKIYRVDLSSPTPNATFIDSIKCQDDWKADGIAMTLLGNGLVIFGVNHTTEDNSTAPTFNHKGGDIGYYENVLVYPNPAVNFTDVGADNWAKPYIDAGVRRDVIDGYENANHDAYFLPGESVRRNQLMKIIANAFNWLPLPVQAWFRIPR